MATFEQMLLAELKILTTEMRKHRDFLGRIDHSLRRIADVADPRDPKIIEERV